MRYTLGLALILILFATEAFAEGAIIKKSNCRATWQAPQTNTDGTNLDDLATYRIYVGNTAAEAQASTNPVATVQAVKADPDPGTVVTWLGCRSLPGVGQRYATVDAVDINGNASVKHTIVPFVLQDDVPPSTATGLSFSDLP